jgi:hypothetical protein
MKRSRLTLVPEPLADDFLALRSAEEQWTEGKGNP